MAAEGSWPKSPEELEFVRCLGKGFFGEVWEAQQKSTGQTFAVKKVRLQLIIENRLDEQLKREINILKGLDHPRIIRLYFPFRDESHMYLGMEFAKGGSLFDRLNQARKFSPEVAARFFRETCEALDYLHHLPEKVIHRDIKPENILLDEKDHIKLADFGWANLIEEHVKRDTFCGTLDYLPPEMIMGTGHDESVDMWNMGVLLYELTTGQSPFGSTNKETTCRLILSVDLRFPTDVDADARNLVAALCRKKPSERLSVRGALAHKFVTKFSSTAEGGGAGGVPGDDADAAAGERPSVVERRIRLEYQRVNAEYEQLQKAKKGTKGTIQSIVAELAVASSKVKEEQLLRAGVEAACRELEKQLAAGEKELEELRTAAEGGSKSDRRDGGRWLGLGKKEPRS